MPSAKALNGLTFKFAYHGQLTPPLPTPDAANSTKSGPVVVHNGILWQRGPYRSWWLRLGHLGASLPAQREMSEALDEAIVRAKNASAIGAAAYVGVPECLVEPRLMACSGAWVPLSPLSRRGWRWRWRSRRERRERRAHLLQVAGRPAPRPRAVVRVVHRRRRRTDPLTRRGGRPPRPRVGDVEARDRRDRRRRVGDGDGAARVDGGGRDRTRSGVPPRLRRRVAPRPGARRRVNDNFRTFVVRAASRDFNADATEVGGARWFPLKELLAIYQGAGEPKPWEAFHVPAPAAGAFAALPDEERRVHSFTCAFLSTYLAGKGLPVEHDATKTDGMRIVYVGRGWD